MKLITLVKKFPLYSMNKLFKLKFSTEIKKTKDCYYKILNLSISANDEEIKKQYFKLAKEKHPDSINSDKKTFLNKYSFEEISEAYDILSNPSKKEAYDAVVLGSNLGKRLMSNNSIYESFSKNSYEKNHQNK